MTRFSTQGSHSGILRTQKLRSTVENLCWLVGSPGEYLRKINTYQNVSLCFIDWWIGFVVVFYIVICRRVTCGWRDVKIQDLCRGQDIQSVDWTWQTRWTVNDLNTADTERRAQAENAPTEQYTRWTLQTPNTMLKLNTTDTEHYRLWTPLTLKTRLNTTGTL